MHLEAFRVQNFKKILDTGWTTCRELTVFVGKNESGKSAIFRGLSKLNPSDNEKYDGLKEFPRSRYTKEFASKDWPVATCRFALDNGERKTLSDLCPLLEGVQNVEFTRYYSWKITTAFNPTPKFVPVAGADLRNTIDEVSKRIQELTVDEGKGEGLATIKTNILNALNEVKTNTQDGVDLTSQADNAVKAIATQINEDWQKELFDAIISSLSELAERIANQNKLSEAEKWAIQQLPKFVYFDRYDILDSAIHMPTFLQELQDNRKGPKHRVTLCLFKHVGLDPENMLALGKYPQGQEFKEDVRRKLDELSIKADSASISMTEQFRDWWEQRKHKFRYDFQGEYFRVWVADDIDESGIELEQRSQGLQYFFSFYLVFLVESSGAHVNTILLLDEPGLHVHGSAQAKIVEFLERLSKKNQILYSTHSPFMIDVNHLERARAVYEGKDGTTKVSEDVWPHDKDSLFPLQAALGYQLAQTLFISKRQVIVEGLTDLWLLKALDQSLAAKGQTRLRQDLVLVPSGGLSKLFPLASMLVGHDIEVAALLDGDEPGRREGKRLVEKLLAGEDRKCLFIGDFTSSNDAELEDIFPEEEYLSAVEEAYQTHIDLTPKEREIAGVVNRVQAVFERKKLGPFEKWKTAAILRDRILATPDKVSDATCDIVEKINESLNSLFP